MSSTRETTEPLPERVLVGRVLRPHGLRGAVLIEPLSDNSERFVIGSELLLRETDAGPVPVRVAERRANPHGLVLRFEGVTSCEAAGKLRGAWLEVPLAAVPTPPPGAYWTYELLGCRCVEERDGELGTLSELLGDGGGIVLRILRPGFEVLVPFVESFVAGFDREARVIRLRLPEGLVETCTSRS